MAEDGYDDDDDTHERDENDDDDDETVHGCADMCLIKFGTWKNLGGLTCIHRCLILHCNCSLSKCGALPANEPFVSCGLVEMRGLAILSFLLSWGWCIGGFASNLALANMYNDLYPLLTFYFLCHVFH